MKLQTKLSSAPIHIYYVKQVYHPPSPVLGFYDYRTHVECRRYNYLRFYLLRRKCLKRELTATHVLKYRDFTGVH